MSEMMTAIYRGESICVLDMLNQYGQYIEDIRSEYRRASQAQELFCPECNGVLELCAGAIIPPYFRHRSLNDCPISRELKTEAGKRSYYSKKMLYQLGKKANAEELVIEERKSKMPHQPVLMRVKGEEKAFIYLDGKTRNYEELKEAQAFYKRENIVPYWFLHKKYQSNSRNIASDEAEVTKLNHGILYYLDTDKEEITFRKAYESPHGERKYFTKTYPMEEFRFGENGEFNQEYLECYHEYVRDKKRELERVLCIPEEEGVEECYFDFSYVYMDAIEEIWVLPRLKMQLEDKEYNEQAKRNREAYLEQVNRELNELNEFQRKLMASKIIEYVNRKKSAGNWIFE